MATNTQAGWPSPIAVLRLQHCVGEHSPGLWGCPFVDAIQHGNNDSMRVGGNSAAVLVRHGDGNQRGEITLSQHHVFEPLRAQSLPPRRQGLSADETRHGGTRRSSSIGGYADATPADARLPIEIREAAESSLSSPGIHESAIGDPSKQLNDNTHRASESNAADGNDRMSQCIEDGTDEWPDQGEGLWFSPVADSDLEDLMPTLQLEIAPRRGLLSSTASDSPSIAHRSVTSVSVVVGSAGSVSIPIVGNISSEASPMAPTASVPGSRRFQVQQSEDVPLERDASAAVPPGSRGHDEGTCRPCAHFWKPSGCSKGDDCERCHLCDEEAFWKYRAVNVQQRRRKHMRRRQMPFRKDGVGKSSTQ